MGGERDGNGYADVHYASAAAADDDDDVTMTALRKTLPQQPDDAESC